MLIQFNTHLLMVSYSFHLITRPLGYQVKELSSKVPETFNLEAKPWIVTEMLAPNKTTVCGNNSIMGGFGVIGTDGYLERTYLSLPNHNIVYFEIKLYVLDNWFPSDRLKIQIDGKVILATNIGFQSSTFPSNLCESPNNHLEPLLIVGSLSHNANNITLRITSNVKREPTIASFGFRDLSLLFTSGAPLLRDRSCFYFNNSIQGDENKKCECEAGFYPDPSIHAKCNLCNNSCSGCFGPSAAECYSCKPGYSFVQRECIKCHDSCNTCSGSNESQCITCSNNLWLHENNTCSSSCDFSSNYKIEIGDFRVCNFANPESVLESYMNESVEEGEKQNMLNPITEAIQATGELASVGTIIMSIASGSPSFLSLVSLAKMMHFIRYLDINYPPKLDYIFHNQNSSSISLDFSPDIPQSIVNAFSNHILPAKFGEYNVSSNFIVNYWSTIFTLGIILLIIFISSTIAHIAKKHNMRYVYLIFNRIKEITRWDLFLIILCSNYDKISLYLSFETFSIAYLVSWRCVLSFLASITMNIFALFVITRTFYAIYHLRKSKYKICASPTTTISHDILQMNRATFEIFFRGLKDETFLQQAFLLFFLVRIYLADMIIGYLYLYPLPQSIMLTLISFIMLLYLLIKRPYREKSNLIEIFIYEFILLIVNIMVLILAVLDSRETQAADLRMLLGDIVIICNVVFNVLGLLFLGFEIVFVAIKAYRILRKSKEKSVWMKIFLLLFERDGMSLEENETRQQVKHEDQECKRQISKNFSFVVQPQEFTISLSGIKPLNEESQSFSLPKQKVSSDDVNDVKLDLSKVNEVPPTARSESPSPTTAKLINNLRSPSQFPRFTIRNDVLQLNDAKDENNTLSPFSHSPTRLPSRFSILNFDSPPRQSFREDWNQLKLRHRQSQMLSPMYTDSPISNSEAPVQYFHNSLRKAFRDRLKSIQIMSDNIQKAKAMTDLEIVDLQNKVVS